MTRGCAAARDSRAPGRSARRSIRRTITLLGALAAGLGNVGFAADAPRPSLQAGVLADVHRVDGRLDEPAWAAAPFADDVRMVEPRPGAPATGRTILKVLAGPRALVFGIRCEDPDAAGIVTFTKERDGDFEFEDHVVVVLDPFQDGRSGYVFAVNPLGARLDALVEPGGESTNTNWDGEWEAATRRDSGGWTAEIRVPIETLSFKRGLDGWLLNVQRRVQRLQETDRWASPSLDYEVFQTSRAGLLTGLPEFDLGLGLGVRPSLVTGFEKVSPEAPTAGVLEPSLDVTQRLGTNLSAALTVNTDFAETEVDTRQTNLTRFPVFFPEKRTFFLQGADIFEFGTGLGEGLVPYFSRRIGLVLEEEVPILAGVKTTGRIGPTSLGVLAVRTREVAGLAPATTMAVLRVQQNLFLESSVGLLATFGDPLGRTGSFEVGTDFRYQTSSFRGSKNFVVGVWGLVTGRDDLPSGPDRTAWGFKVDYPNDLWDCYLLHRRVGDGFDPSLGFVARPGVMSFESGCRFSPRPKDSLVRQLKFRAYPAVTTDLEGKWESYAISTTPLGLRLESGDGVEVGVTPAGERLTEPFEIVDGVVIPPGEYHFTRAEIEVETASKRRLAADLAFRFGSFYDGTLLQWEGEASYTPSPLFTFLGSVEHNRGRLGAGDFDLTLLGLKVRLNLSPDLQLNSFVQYDTESASLGTNTRLRWSFHPRGNLFLVYNHNLREIENRFQADSNELLVKAQYTFRR